MRSFLVIKLVSNLGLGNVYRQVCRYINNSS